jgi:hypothetical protein
VIEMEDTDPRIEDDDQAESEELEAEILRADHPIASTRWGTTAEEAVAGEGLDRALAQEVPEPDRAEEELEFVDEAGDDDEDELVANAVEVTDPFAPPEEAAISVTDDPPGITDHAEPADDDEDLDGVEEYLDETQEEPPAGG